MNIRPYKKKDAQRIAAIFNETSKSLNWDDFSDEQKKVMYLPLDVTENLMGGENHTLVLEDEDEIRAFTMMKPDGYINFLYVDSNHLRKGYARSLLTAIEALAREAGMSSIYLHASEYAARLGYYEKLGYINVGRETHKIVDVDFHSVRLEKKL